MRLLLDTNVFIWACGDAARLKVTTRRIIEAEDSDVFVSAASVWEIAMKSALGRLPFPLDRVSEILAALSFEPLPVTMAHAVAAGALPRHHQDPFDRMLVAQARLEGLTLTSSDRKLAAYDVAFLPG